MTYVVPLEHIVSEHKGRLLKVERCAFYGHYVLTFKASA